MKKQRFLRRPSKTCFFRVRFGVRNNVIFDIRGLIGGLGFPKVWGCLRFGVLQSLGFQVWGSLALPWFGVPGLGFPDFAVVWDSKFGVPCGLGFGVQGSIDGESQIDIRRQPN